VNALLNFDIPVVLGCLLVYLTVFVLVNLISDVLYRVADRGSSLIEIVQHESSSLISPSFLTLVLHPVPPSPDDLIGPIRFMRVLGLRSRCKICGCFTS